MRKLIKALLCVAAVAMLLAGCSRSVELLGGLTESDSNEIVATLSRAGIESDKASAKRGYSVSVGSDSFSRAVDILKDAGLPREARTTIGEIFKKDGMISTPMEERVRFLFGTSQELEKTLSGIDGVISARVHIVLPERVAPGEPVSPSSAAVFIKHQPGVQIEMLEYSIRELVAASIPGLARQSADRITVAMIPATDTRSLDAMARPARAAAMPTSMSDVARGAQPQSGTNWRLLALALLLASCAGGLVLWRARLPRVQ